MSLEFDHIGDEAELYALGMLADGERAGIDAHVAACAGCAQRVGAAEAAVASMVETSLGLRQHGAPRAAVVRTPPRQHGRRPRAAWLAAAACLSLAISTASLARQNADLRAGLDADGATFGAMVRGHFLHVAFVSSGGAPYPAKVVYERHGGWYEVLATRLEPGVRVSVVRSGRTVALSARFQQRGPAFILALPSTGPLDEVQLLDARGRIVARARPVPATGRAGSPR